MVRLNQVKIKNFRNFQGEHKFDFFKDITIFLGDNGNGKSSIFDAIQWCISGKIARFGNNSTESLRDILINNKADDCFVEMLFSNNLKLKRSISRNSNITVSCQDENGRIVRGEENVKGCVNEAFKKLQNSNFDLQESLKASLLAQDQVLNLIANDGPKDRYRSISSILGMDEITNLKQNFEKVRNLIENKISDKRKSEKECEEEIESQKSKLKKYKELNIEKISEFNFDDKQNEKIRLMKEKDQIKNTLDNFNLLQVKIGGIIQNLNLITETINTIDFDIKRLKSEKEEIIKDCALIDSDFEQNEKNIEQAEKEAKLLFQNKKYQDELKKIENKLLNFELSIEVDENIQQRLYESQRSLDKYTYTLSMFKEYNDLLQNRENIPKFIDELKQKFNQLDIELQEKQNKIISLKSEFLSDEKNDIDLLVKMVQEASEFVNVHKNFKNNCPVCNQRVVNISKHLDERVDYLLHKINIATERISNNKRRIKEVEGEILNIKDERNLTKSNISNLKLQYEEVEKKINIIEGDYLYTKENFNLDSDKLILKINDLHDNIEKQTQYLQLKNEKHKLKLKLGEISGMEFSGLNLERLLEKKELLNGKQDDLLAQRKKVEENIERLQISLDDCKSMNKLINECSKFYGISSNIDLSKFLINLKDEKEKKIDVLSQELKRYEDIIVYNNLKDNLFNKEVRLQHIKKSIINLKIKYDIVGKEITHINDLYSFSRIVNSNRSVIQRYFNYLNPNVSTYRNLYFNIDDKANTLDIEINNNNNNRTVKATSVLSSGQLNVLAISIFIAKNISQFNSDIDFIAIDDPIQNMDDINQFSMIDVLSQLNKQVIFTTHDAKYVNLFLKKNEVRLNDISVYYLDAENDSYDNILESN